MQIPADTELQLRLKTKVAAASSKVKDAVEALLIAPVIVDGRFVVPAGTLVRGSVTVAKPAAKPEERAVLVLSFTEMDVAGQKVAMESRMKEVENARESVDDKGQIQGILASETISARMDQGINKLAQRYGGLADILSAAKGSVIKESVADIAFDPGVEFSIVLTKPLEIKNPPADAAPRIAAVADEEALATLVVSQPFQTMAVKPSKPSDITNLMYIGTQQEMEKGFAEAGWSSAAGLTAQSKLETFRAIAEMRGYKEAPVSVLLLDGKPPDLVFQKQNNTFAERHHLRIWRRPDTFQGKPVWVCAATHDTGIDFSPENRTFIHKIDSNIDRERAKVVNDLLLTGLVKSLALVDRPSVPTKGQNATGDKLETDGKMAVLLF